MMLFSRRFVNCVALAAVLAVSAGCGGIGDARSGLVQVTGKVTIDGTPLTSGMISFIPAQGTEAFNSPIDATGNYSLAASPSSPGALPGEYKVIVVATDGPPKMGEKGTVIEAKSLVPEKFKSPETSGLTGSVKAGQPNVIDFPLKSS